MVGWARDGRELEGEGYDFLVEYTEQDKMGRDGMIVRRDEYWIRGWIWMESDCFIPCYRHLFCLFILISPPFFFLFSFFFCSYPSTLLLLPLLSLSISLSLSYTDIHTHTESEWGLEFITQLHSLC